MENGQFVKVGKDIGIVIRAMDKHNIPDDHLAIWYGESIDIEGNTFPSVKTVPAGYCIPIDGISIYH